MRKKLRWTERKSGSQCHLPVDKKLEKGECLTISLIVSLRKKSMIVIAQVATNQRKGKSPNQNPQKRRKGSIKNPAAVTVAVVVVAAAAVHLLIVILHLNL